MTRNLIQTLMGHLSSATEAKKTPCNNLIGHHCDVFRYKILLMLTLLISMCLLMTGCGSSSSNTANSTPTYKVAGQFQKGPFSIGSQVTICELDEELNPTGTVYYVQINDDLGNFEVKSKIKTHLVEIIGDGFYMDELTGQLAPSRIQLRAIVDLGSNVTPTVNILTSLQALRLKKLMSQGSSYSNAEIQSRNEVLAAFGIDPLKISSLSSLYSMKIDGNSDADSVLLATSTIISKMASNAAIANTTTQTAELSNYISSIAAQIATTGTITNQAIVAARNTAATQINLASVRNNVETYYANRGTTIVAPKFEEWVDTDTSGILPRRLMPISGISFSDISGVEPDNTISSNLVILSGVGSGISVPVTVNSGTTIIKNGVAINGTTTTAKDGDTIALKTKSLGYGLTRTSSIVIGTTSISWRVSTKPLGGTIRMLTGSSLVLQNNGDETITIPVGSTNFNFTETLQVGSTYNISVKTQPIDPAQICTVANASGTVGATPSNIIVSCAGPVSGLAYTDVTGVSPQQAITSNAITISGLGVDIVATVTVDSNTTIIKNGSAVSESSTTVVDGDTVAMRVTSLGYGMTKTSSITIASSSATWRVVTKPLNGTITGLSGSGLVLQVNGGNDITVPAGSSSFSFNSQIANGATYTISVSTQPNTPLQYCAVTNSSGTVGSSSSEVMINCTSSVELAYVADGGSNNVSSFVLATDKAGFYKIGTMTVGNYPQRIVISPTGKFAYVTSKDSNDVTALSINKNTGTLTKIASYPAGTAPYSLAIHPAGGFLYVNGVIYSVDQTTGTLTNAGSFVSGTGEQSFIAIEPSGKYLYTNGLAYSINLTTGALTSIGAGVGGMTMTFSPDGKFAYLSPNGGPISTYSINLTTGVLSSISTNSEAVFNYGSISIHPSGQYLYGTTGGHNKVAIFTVNPATGVLTLIGTPTANSGSYYTAVDKSGRYVFVSGAVHSIDTATGLLTYLGYAAGVGGYSSASMAFVELP